MVLIGRALSYDEIMAEARKWLRDRTTAQSATTIDDPPSS
jgi:hypothetical protein